jgi:IS4 transposase
MRHHNSLMHDLLKFVPWREFDRLVDEHDADRRVRTLTTKSQFVALVHAQLAGAASLREIEATLASHAARLYHLGAKAPKKSTLADANAKRPPDLFAALFAILLRRAHRGLRRAARDAIRLIDSTGLPLSALSEQWASFDAHSCSAKLHVMYDPDAGVPVHFAVTPARVNDIVEARAMAIEPGATYVFDLAYYDWSWWARLERAGCRFVTRLKSHTRTALVAERAVPAGDTVVADRIVRLSPRLRTTGRNPIDHPVREVHIRLDSGKILRLVSNDLAAPADEIAALYKARWQIELFFRWVKQTLKIRRFLGTSENAIRVQIAVALIAYLLLRLAHAAQTTVDSLLTFTRLVRTNLMHLRSIHALTTAAPPRRPPNLNQYEFALC